MDIKSNPIVSTLTALAAKKPIASLSDYLKSQDPELAKKTAETTQNLKNVLASLKTGKIDLSAQRKQAAVEKVARIKQAIQALKLSAFVDPKIVARIAARLSKELAQAVKDYADAGGKSSDISVPDTSSTPSDQTAKTPDSADQNVSAATDTAAQPSADPAPIVAQPTPHDDKTATAAASYNAGQKTSAPVDNSHAQDDAFKKDVRDAIKQLRDLVNQHRAVLKGTSDEKHLDDADKDLKAAEGNLGSIVSTGPVVSVHA